MSTLVARNANEAIVAPVVGACGVFRESRAVGFALLRLVEI
jgi:hypothetical protein